MKSLPTILLLWAAGLPLAAQTDQADIGLEVRAVFAHRCGECHGPEIRKPKGKFGFVTDLDRVREKFVADAEPEDSDLWLSLTDEFEPMPPAKAQNGPLTATELDLVRRWLAAGAPSPRTEAAGPVRAEDAPSPVPAATERAEANHLAALHPIVVHFPVALVLVALLAELLVWIRGSRHENTVRLCLVVGTLGAIVAAISGWSAAEAEGYKDATVFAHRWLGVAALATALLALVAIEIARRGRRPALLLPGRLLLVAAAALTALAGHEGGVLVHGPLGLF